MGLDITAYRKLTRAPEGDSLGIDARYDAELVTIYANPDFPGREAPLENGKCYRATEEDGFRAGGYIGYSAWRERLAALAGYRAGYGGDWDVPESAPFVELVNFSDCEGVLGPAVCAKLAADFAAFQDRADATGDDYFRAKYAEWRKAMEMAADGGAVEFH
jgi:hypothetical protein